MFCTTPGAEEGVEYVEAIKIMFIMMDVSVNPGKIISSLSNCSRFI